MHPYRFFFCDAMHHLGKALSSPYPRSWPRWFVSLSLRLVVTRKSAVEVRNLNHGRTTFSTWMDCTIRQLINQYKRRSISRIPLQIFRRFLSLISNIFLIWQSVPNFTFHFKIASLLCFFLLSFSFFFVLSFFRLIPIYGIRIMDF